MSRQAGGPWKILAPDLALGDCRRETLDQEPLPTSPSFTSVPTSTFVLLLRLKESPWKGQVKDRQPQPSAGLEWIEAIAALLAACLCSQVW